MSTAMAYGSGALAVLRRDLHIYLSYRLRFLTQVLNVLFTLAMFFYISRLIRVDALGSADAYFGFVVIGMVILQSLTTTISTGPGGLRHELVAGTFERIAVSPFGARAGVAAMMLFPLIQSFVIGVVTLVVAGVVFGLPITWGTAPLAVPVVALATLAFAPLGMLLTALLLVAKQATAGTTYIVAGLALVSGIYFPVTLLPGWAQWLSAVQPFTPAVDLLRHLLVGTPLGNPAWLEIAKLAGFAVVLVPLGLWALSAALRYSRRRATLIEY